MSNNYSKPPLSLEDQIKLLKDRNLLINNINFTAAKLNHVGYYHLSAYFKSFQDKHDQFHKNVDFEQILNLYVFDRKIKLYCFDAIERIELSFKSVLTNKMTVDRGVFWYLEKSLFHKSYDHSRGLEHVLNMVNRIKNKDNCVKDYFKKYSDETYLPSWILMEVLPLGSTLKLFQGLNREYRQKVAAEYGIDEKVLVSWLTLLLDIRNICAHHERLWNRRMKKIVIPKESKGFSESGKIWNAFLVIHYFLQILSPESELISKIKNTLEKSHVDLTEMGFSEGWQEFLPESAKTSKKDNPASK